MLLIKGPFVYIYIYTNETYTMTTMRRINNHLHLDLINLEYLNSNESFLGLGQSIIKQKLRGVESSFQ